MQWYLLFLFPFQSLSLTPTYLTNPPPTVESIDINRYYGTWFQIADYPQLYEMLCNRCTTASYHQGYNDSIIVQNKAWYISSEESCMIEGYATIPNQTEPSKLEVTFFEPFKANYWIVEVGPIQENGLYSYSIVSDPYRLTLYVLSRSPMVNNYDELISKVTKYGFDVLRLRKTDQSCFS